MRHSNQQREHSPSDSPRRQQREDNREDKPPIQRFKLQETQTLMLQGVSNDIKDAERVFTDLSISIGTSVPDEVNIQNRNVFVKYPSVQVAVSVFQHLQGEMNLNGYKIKVQYYPVRKIDLTVAYDWYCEKCDYKNFGRRNKCYRCESDKTGTCKLSYSTQPASRPFKEESAQNCSLMLRGSVLTDIDQNVLLELFESIVPVKDVRQIKNKLTGEFKDFAFLEFFSPEETSQAFREANEPGFKIAGQKVTVMFSRNKSNDDYYKPLPYETEKRERKVRERPQLEDNYYHRQRQREIQIQKARPSITMEQLKQKREQEMKKHQPVQKELNEEQSKRRQAELLSRQWQREMKVQTIMYICPACSRKFQSLEQMKLHEKTSKLHAFNISKLDKNELSL